MNNYPLQQVNDQCPFLSLIISQTIIIIFLNLPLHYLRLLYDLHQSGFNKGKIVRFNDNMQNVRYILLNDIFGLINGRINPTILARGMLLVRLSPGRSATLIA